jgi:DNA-binding MarR family transcriptional regulator
LPSRTVTHPTSAAALHVLVRGVRPLSRHLLAAVERRLEGTGVSIPLRGLMERLYEAGPQTVPALGRALMIPRQFALKLEGEASARGLVERVANAAHRRSSLIRLTPAGRAVIEADLEREAAMLASIAVRFDADDVEAATRVLAGLAEALADGDRGGS